MKDYALRTQTKKRYDSIKGALIFLILSIVFLVSSLFTREDILDAGLLYGLAHLFAPWLTLIAVFWFICFVISIVDYTNNIYIVRNTAYPEDWCYDVKIITNTLSDLYIKENSKNLCIRYYEYEGKGAIECKYALDGKEYNCGLTINFAKHLLDCEFFKYL